MSLLLLLTFAFAGPPAKEATLTLQLRTQVQPFKAVDSWENASLSCKVSAKETAIVICDMWDDHWCHNAALRCGVLAKKADPVIRAARAKGIFIIHAPSDCMAYYQDSPARKRMQAYPKVAMPARAVSLPDPPLPVDDSDGGCDDPKPAKESRAWKKQHDAITIDEEKDGITDNGQEVYNALQARGIKTLLVMGVHTNMCVLNRTFAIKAMTRAGVKCILIRDLTDAMYNPARRPEVSHEEGTNLIIRHIERHWCPTCTSKDLLAE